MNVLAMIPCYNVAKYCKPVIEETLRFVNFIILIDDGSTDGTGEILRQIRQKNGEKVHLIVFPKNRGKGAALLEGMKYALSSTSFDVLVTLDSDGQHPPSEIPHFVSYIGQGADFVIGRRTFHHMPFRNRIANTVISFLLHQMYSEAPTDTQSGFRAFTRRFVQKIVDQVTGRRYEMEFRCILLALRDGDAIAQHPIATIYVDENGSSHFSCVQDSIRILHALFKYWRNKSL